MQLLNNPIISIIGSRSCSQNGKNLARKFSYELSQCGITIASGLAKGIDTFAHLYSYKEKGKTIAVLANGFYHIFPKENVGLYEKILENDGLVISEYSPNIHARTEFFLERNRIISGLSLGVLVVESGYRSGTSVTARLAKVQNKKIFALPHEIWDSHGVGTNKLIRNGATLVTCIEDIFQELSCSIKQSNSDSFFNSSKVTQNLISKLSSSIPKINRYDINSCIEILSNTKRAKSLNKRPLKDSKYQFVYDLITDNPISVNDLCKKTNTSISVILNTLFSLELEGYIKKVEGGYVCILDN